MVSALRSRRYGPIGVDLGSRSVKLVQLNSDGSRLLAAARWELPPVRRGAAEADDGRLVDALRRAHESREFRGRDAVLCLAAHQMLVQNIRVARSPDTLEQSVLQEAASRLPFAAAEAEVRYIEAGDVRHGEAVKREVIVMACPKAVVRRWLDVVEGAGLRPVAVDAEPLALVRCYHGQFRRDEDRRQSALLVHIGHSNTTVVIARGAETLFVKSLDFGGRHLDEVVARMLGMQPAEAAALRRNNGQRRGDQQDQEMVRTLTEAVRPAVDRLLHEVSLCQRYFSVTFRGQPVGRLVVSGGEASPALVEAFSARLNLPGELGDPLRHCGPAESIGRHSQWDIATGLALRAVS